jgi:hypothetical protein
VRKSALILVNAMHITASVYINDNERGLLADYEDWLEELAPHEPVSRYRHNRTGEDNGDAHLKRQIMGRLIFLPFYCLLVASCALDPTVTLIAVLPTLTLKPTSVPTKTRPVDGVHFRRRTFLHTRRMDRASGHGAGRWQRRRVAKVIGPSPITRVASTYLEGVA